MKTILMKERLWELVISSLTITITNAFEGGSPLATTETSNQRGKGASSKGVRVTSTEDVNPNRKKFFEIRK